MQLRSAIVGLALLLPGAVVAQEIEMKVELMGPLGTIAGAADWLGRLAGALSG